MVIDWCTMRLYKAIETFLATFDTSTLDERVFYNVLKDLNAFEQQPTSQYIIRAFIGKGFLKDIWRGKSEWKIRSRQFLIDFQGFQADKVDFVVNEFIKGFGSFVPPANYDPYREIKNMPEITIPQAPTFKKYDTEEICSTHPSMPDNFTLQKGDIVFVKNGTARIVSVHEDHIKVVYIKQNGSKDARRIYYDEQIDYIITPRNNVFMKSESFHKFLFIRNCAVSDSNAKFIGTYADSIKRVVLTPYTLRLKGFIRCSKDDFMSVCVDIDAFEHFVNTND